MPKTTIIIVSYNTRELTLECIRSVFDQTKDIDFELIVVDNNSSDRSADAIAEAFPGVHLIRSEKNLGFAAANNRAAEVAQGDYLLLLNPDTVVLDRAIDRLVSAAEAAPEARIWGGRTLYPDGRLNPTSCWRRPTLWSLLCQMIGLARAFPNSALFNAEAYGGWDRSTRRTVDIVTGCFLLIHRSFWNELNGFDEGFFMYGEEADLCLRAKTKGARPMVFPEPTIIHYDGASDTVRADRRVRLLSAKRRLFERHMAPLTCWCATRALDLGVAIRVIAARAQPRATREAQSATWRSIWRRRSQWH